MTFCEWFDKKIELFSKLETVLGGVCVLVTHPLCILFKKIMFGDTQQVQWT